MPRPRTDNERIHLQIHRDIIAQLNVLLADPVTGRLRYGALSAISNKLFAQFLKGFNQSEDRIAYLKAYGVELEQPINPNADANASTNNEGSPS